VNRRILGLLATSLALGACGSDPTTPSTDADASDGDAASDADAGLDGSKGTGVLASHCAGDGDCASGICIASQCTNACAGGADCLPGPEWACVAAPGRGTVCECAPTGAERCDGKDNDCNGEPDDGAMCGPLEQCEAAVCVCSEEHRCGTACVDVNRSNQHCGACGNACPLGSICTAGVCDCQSERVACGDACVDLARDAENCGQCGIACGAYEICLAGNCECAQTLCGSACTDLQNDPRNCGQCARDCLDSSCDGGMCQPLFVAQFGTTFLAVDAEAVYSSDFDGTSNVLKTTLADGNWTRLNSPTSFPAGLAMNDTHVFWADWDEQLGGAIMRYPKGATSAAPHLTLAGAPVGLALDATNLYFTDINGLRVVQAPLDGSSPQDIATTGNYPWAIAVDGTNVYWTDPVENTISTTPIGGTSVTILARNQRNPTSIAVDAGALYWTNFDAGELMTLSVTGGTPSPVAFGEEAHSLVLNATHLYFATRSAVLRVSRATSEVDTLVSGAAPRGIAIGGAYLYYSNLSELYKVAK
jgi:hypothetical protein